MKVLILEDNENSRIALVKIVKSCMRNIQVYPFESRAEAYLCAMDQNIDLFLLDIILKPKERNDSSGIHFAKDIRDNVRYKTAPIIFITSLAGLEVTLLKQVHCYNYIEKPIDSKRIRRHILEALDAINADRRVRQPEKISLRYDGVSYPVNVDNVIYIVSRRGVLYIHEKEGVIEIPHLPANTFLSRVRDNKFLVPLKGTAVNIRYIKNIDFKNSKVFLKQTDDTIDIGGRLKKRFREEFEECYGLIK